MSIKLDQARIHCLTITQKDAQPGIEFSRESYNYLVAPKKGVIAFSPGSESGAGATNGTGAHLAVTHGAVIPGQNDNLINLGSTAYHWNVIHGKKLALNASEEPTENLYVNGTTRFAIGDNDTVDNKRVVVGSSGKRYLSLGGSGIQAYSAADAGSVLYLQYQGGSITIGQSASVTSPVTIHGNLLAGAKDTYNIGSTEKPWNKFYIKNIYVTSTDNATSATTGSIITAGGIGIAKDVYSTGAFTSHRANGPRYIVNNDAISGWFGINSDGSRFGIYEATNSYYLIQSTTTTPGDPTPKKGTTIPLELTLGQRLIFTGISSDTSQIYFSRENNPSYFNTATGGYFCFIPNGANVGTATSVLTIKNGSVQPGTTNVITLGALSLAWSNTFSEKFTIVRDGKLYGYAQGTTTGTTSAVGIGRLSLGNETAQGTAGNARGELLLYGYNTGYIRVQASIDTATQILYLRDHGANAYVVATKVTSAVGSNSLPVYVDNKGIVTTVSKVTFSNTTSGTSFAFTESRSEGSSVSFGVGSGNVNHGIYSNTLGKWIAYADTTGVYLNGNANTATALRNGRTLKVALNSTNASTAFNGEANVHDIGVSGTLAPGNGGTGQTTLKNAANSLINALDTASSTPTDADYYISQYVGGGTTTTTYHRRPMSALWSYISGKSDARYVNLSGDTMTGSLTISHAANATMNHTTTNPRIVFSENGTQPVGLVYTDYDTYRAPAGLKVLDMSGSNGNAWFEVQGSIYSGGNIYTIHPTGGETNISVAHGPSEYLMLWGNNSSGARGLWDTTKKNVITVTDTASTFHGNAETATKATQDGSGNTITSKYVTLDTNQTIKATKSFQNQKYYSSFNFYPSLITGGESRIATIYGWCAADSNATVLSTSYISFRQYSYTENSTTVLANYDQFRFPATSAGKTANNTYYILTSKSAVTVAQGGTGRTTLTSGYALIGNGTSQVSLRAITDNTSVAALGWSSSVGTNLITNNTLAYWNGAYSGTTSNLAYCVKGAFGDIVTHNVSEFATSSHSHSYLPLAGGTMTGGLTLRANNYDYYSNTNSYGLNCANSDIVRVNSIYTADAADTLSEGIHFYVDGSTWDTLTANNGTFYFASKASVSGASLTGTATIRAGKVYGAVWNDYAEYRSQFENISAGRVAYCKNDGKLRITTERLQKFEGVVSDTFGFAIGETDNAKTPLAVSGRVLVYTYEPRDIFNSGDCVCAAPNGTVSKMSREEIAAYPDRIVGIVSEIPEYETWGTDEVLVNGRIWIKVK